MDFITPGMKVKNFRKDLKISQRELSKNIISPAMLCYIENDVYTLNEKIAKQLCAKLNCYNNSHKKIDYKTLLTPLKEVEINYVNNVIKNINTIDFSSFEKIRKNFEQSKNQHQKVRLYYVLGAFLFNKFKNLDKSLCLLENAIELSIANDYHNFSLPIIVYLQRIYFRIDPSYGRALYFNNKDYIIEKKNKISGLILYNFAVFFEKIKDYEQAIYIYNLALPLLSDSIYRDWCKNNLGICYYENGAYHKSINLFIDLKLETKNKSILKKCYSNILMNSLKLDNIFLLEQYIQKLKKILKELPKEDQVQGFYSLGKVFLNLDDRYNAMKCFEREIELGINLNNTHFFLEKYEESISFLLDLYIESDINKLQKLENSIIDISFTKISKILLNKIINKYLLAYTKQEFLIFFNKLINS